MKEKENRVTYEKWRETVCFFRPFNMFLIYPLVFALGLSFFYNKRILRTLFSIEKNKTFQINVEFELVALGSRTKEQCIFTCTFFLQICK